LGIALQLIYTSETMTKSITPSPSTRGIRVIHLKLGAGLNPLKGGCSLNHTALDRQELRFLGGSEGVSWVYGWMFMFPRYGHET